MNYESAQAYKAILTSLKEMRDQIDRVKGDIQVLTEKIDGLDFYVRHQQK